MASATERNLLLFSLLFTYILSSVQQTTDTVTDLPPTPDSGSTPPRQTTNLPAITSSAASFLPTTAVPTDATELPPNTDIGPCICDLTVYGCDVNCCCDEDCTIDDLNTFSECIENKNIVDENVCFRSDVIFRNNAPVTVNTSDPSLFCVVIDNYKQRNYYTIPQTVETVERFVEVSEQYGDTSYAAPTYENETYADFYKSGDPIYTLYESLALGVLGLPTTLVDSQCQDGNPAAYLHDEAMDCVRVITSLEDQCEMHPALSALTYYDGFKLVTTPSFLQTYPPPDPRLVNVTDAPTTEAIPSTIAANGTNNATDSPPTTPYNDTLYNSMELLEIVVREPVLCSNVDLGVYIPCDFDGDDVPTPVFNFSSGSCDYVVKQVSYFLTHNGTDGIMSAEVQLVLGSYSLETGVHLTQYFSTNFDKHDESDEVFELSGNPGYVIGEPLMAGNPVTITDPDGTVRNAIQLGSDRNNWLTIVKGTADGTCVTDADSRIPVTFGEDVRSGCTITVAYENVSDICEFIQASALNALTGQMPEYVAMFGNSLVEVVGDWVPIIVDELRSSPTSPTPGTCDNMVMALHIEVLYANTGSLANPQAKVVGVRFNYAEAKTVRYHCSGAYCQVGSSSLTQNFEVASSVGFIETSSYPAPVLAERPSFESKLPNDFFYPFTIAGSSVATRLNLDVRLHYMLLGFYFVLFVFTSRR